MKQEKNIWEQSRVELFQKLDCRETGLSQEDAALRLLKYGANELHAGKPKSGFSGGNSYSGRRDLCLYGGRREYDRHSGGHHHECNSGDRADGEGICVAGQPEADVRPHRQGTAGRSDRTDPRP